MTRTAQLRPLAAAIGLLLATQAQAFEFDTGDSGWSVRWDNTVRYSAAFRLREQNAALLGQPNADDGDRNFNRGLISNRIDLFSELDASYNKRFGGRLSAAGWYDSVYNGRNDNPGFAGGAFPNHVPDFNQFTPTTRRLHGRQVELRDAFVFGRADLAGRPLTVRLGNHALVWGESLFFAGNAIAGAQGPFDISRLVADPTAQFKEFTLPVPQVSGQLQLSPDVSIGAYYQFRWVPSRLPAVGSYFSQGDVNVDGAERLYTPVGIAPRTADIKPKNSGQFGLQLRWRLEDTDLGFYVLRFHDKFFQQVARLDQFTVPFPPGTLNLPASYYLTWPQKTMAYGFSASRTFGDANVALEASIRRKQGLSSNGFDIAPLALTTSNGFAVLPPTNNTDNPGYAVGNTAHVNLSTIWTVPQTALWREASFAGEVAWTRLLSCRVNCAAVAQRVTQDAVALRGVFTPTYRQVAPGWDIDVPMGLGWVPSGSRSAITPGPSNSGDITLGVNALYESVWRVGLAYTHYFGPAGTFTDATGQYTYLQSLKDRDFISFNVRRTF